MSTFNGRKLKRGAFPVALLLAAGATWAAGGGYTNPAATPSIKAAPDNAHPHTLDVLLDDKGDWSKVQSTSVKMRFQYSVKWSQQPNKGKENFGRIWVGIGKLPPAQGEGGVSFDKAQLFDLNEAQILAGGTQNVTVPFAMLVPDGIPGTNIATYCDMEKASQLKQGRTLHELLEKGVDVKLGTVVSLRGFYTMGGGPNTSRRKTGHMYEAEIQAPMTIKCMGNPALAAKLAPLPGKGVATGSQTFGAKFVVNSVDLSTLHATPSKTCPIDVTIKATLKGTGGGEVKYWMEEVGANNAVQQLTTSLPGKANEPNIRVLMQTVSLKPGPQDKAQPSAGLNNLKIATKGTLVKRSYRLHVIAPNKITSDKLDVAVTCDP